MYIYDIYIYYIYIYYMYIYIYIYYIYIYIAAFNLGGGRSLFLTRVSDFVSGVQPHLPK